MVVVLEPVNNGLTRKQFAIYSPHLHIKL